MHRGPSFSEQWGFSNPEEPDPLQLYGISRHAVVNSTIFFTEIQ